MPQTTVTFWTDDRVDETVTSAYIHSHLRPSEQEVLNRPLYYGGDLTDDTYQDWILSRARRFFLILVAAGIPDQIFGIADDCLDDDDLPIAEEAVPDLRLSREPDKSIDKRFYRTQFRYLTRIVEDGEHIRYAKEENVPLVSGGLKSVITSINKDGIDTVKLPSTASKVFVRRKVTLDSKVTEETILSEIAEMKKFSHEHVISVYASYLQDNVMSVLSYPAAEYNLKSFLSDPPKAFEALDKSQRRKILINWPHCLANALAFLHLNGGHHGAIRPSNIHISSQWQISLGQLDGDGILCTSTKSDDLEAYQFAPPERWKRAVTVQNTGSGKLMLPSGGRAARKAPAEEADPLDPSSRKRSGSSSGTNLAALHAYAFLPASKSEFTRFRLSTAVDPTALIPPPPRRTRPSGSQDTGSSGSRGAARTPVDRERNPLVRPPSALSSTSSGDRRRHKAHSQGIFLAAPESRTAVVQTWKSVQHDSFAADVFSLAAVIMEILTVLCKKTTSSFARYRSAKNRNAGRGGGLADASYHANLGQVMAWAQSLADEAEKKVKKDDSQTLRAVGAVLQITVQCLERSPDARLKSDVLEHRLGDHIKRFGNIDPLHCSLPSIQQSMPPSIPGPTLEPSLMPSSSRLDRSRSRPRGESIPEDAELDTRPSTSVSSVRPNTSRTIVPSMSPPAVSLRSLPSLNLDMDARSEPSVMGSTVIGSTPSRDQSFRYPPRRNPDRETRNREIQAWAVSDMRIQKADDFEYMHQNDSDVDPRLRLSTDASEAGAGVFTYMNYSTSPSEDGEGSTFMYPLPPQGRPPTRDLPPVPPSDSSKSSRSQASAKANSRTRQVFSPPPAPARGPTREETDMLQKLSRAVPSSRQPVRMSSLPHERMVAARETGPREAFQPPTSKFAREQRAPSPQKGQSELPHRQRERMYRQRAWNPT
jgi:serine/threonine protein kinase